MLTQPEEVPQQPRRHGQRRQRRRQLPRFHAELGLRRAARRQGRTNSSPGKKSATVPLFLAQTFVQSLRDVGYDSTTSALCEHVDNAIGAEATEVRIFFRQIGRKG